MTWTAQNEDQFGEPFDPHEFEGVVLAGDKEYIASRVAAQMLADPNFILWEWQAFENHDHPAFRLSEVSQELSLVAQWMEVLSSRFPMFEFVIEQQPCFQATWYQKGESAPFEDEPLWELAVRGTTVTFATLEDFQRGLNSVQGVELRDLLKHSASISLREADVATKNTEFEDFEAPRIHPSHRGLMTITHKESRTEVIFATKIIRTVVGVPPAKE